ncbi:MAG: hypothetical protein AB7N76_02740 [Planctomycetota bacterium]
MSDPWEAWGELAGAAWQHELAIPGASLLERSHRLEEEVDGRYVWVEESLHRSQTGVYLFVRAERRPERADSVTVIPGADADELVTAIRGLLGIDPGRVEVLGRGGIEIGLLPGDAEEED